MGRWASWAIAVALVPSYVAAQNAMEILQKVEETYTNLKSCDIEYVERNETRSSSHQSTNEFHRHIQMAPGGKLREEFQPGLVTVSNGTDVWRYNPQNQEYTRRPGRSDRNPLPYQRFARRVASARVLREEDLPVGGASVACYAIEASLTPPQQMQPGLQIGPIQYWVDKARYLVLQQRRTQVDNQPGYEQLASKR
ncbi:MAG: LolA family protein [Bryobacteraceae bacterium]